MDSCVPAKLVRSGLRQCWPTHQADCEDTSPILASRLYNTNSSVWYLTLHQHACNLLPKWDESAMGYQRSSHHANLYDSEFYNSTSCCQIQHIWHNTATYVSKCIQFQLGGMAMERYSMEQHDPVRLVLRLNSSPCIHPIASRQSNPDYTSDCKFNINHNICIMQPNNDSSRLIDYVHSNGNRLKPNWNCKLFIVLFRRCF